jgi:hypothetical protein
VPQKIAKTSPRKSRLFSRKLASRERIESSWLSERSAGSLKKSSVSVLPTASTRNARKYGPIADCANECTELMTPLRTTNVPKIAR